jgi:hypothetical protein
MSAHILDGKTGIAVAADGRHIPAPGMETASPSGSSATSPASIHFVLILACVVGATSCRFAAAPRPTSWCDSTADRTPTRHWPRHGRHDLDLVAHVLHQHFAHAAARRGQRHLDVHGAGRILVLADVALVDQPQIDDVDRDLGVEASLQLLPDDGLMSSSEAPGGTSGATAAVLPMASASWPAMRNRLPSMYTVKLPPRAWVM